jgi:hypothetical protein
MRNPSNPTIDGKFGIAHLVPGLGAIPWGRYGHAVVLVETFVDPEHSCGTTYPVSAWQPPRRPRMRKPRSMLFLGMFRRLSNSLFMHWISKQTRSHHKTTTDFFSSMNASHHRYAFPSLFAAHLSFSKASWIGRAGFGCR